MHFLPFFIITAAISIAVSASTTECDLSDILGIPSSWPRNPNWPPVLLPLKGDVWLTDVIIHNIFKHILVATNVPVGEYDSYLIDAAAAGVRPLNATEKEMALIHLELWPTYTFETAMSQQDGLIIIGRTGYIGQYNLFIDKTFVETQWKKKGIIVDHDKGMIIKNVTSQLATARDYLGQFEASQKRCLIDKADWCSETGLFIGKGCTGDPLDCPVILGDLPRYNAMWLPQIVNNLGWNFTVLFVGDGMDKVAAAVNKPTVLSSYVPHSVTASGTFSPILLPAHDADQYLQSRWNGSIASSPPSTPIFKLCSTGFDSKHRLASYIAHRVSLSPSEINKLILAVINGKTESEAACDFLRTTSDWKSWLPPYLPMHVYSVRFPIVSEPNDGDSFVQKTFAKAIQDFSKGPQNADFSLVDSNADVCDHVAQSPDNVGIVFSHSSNPCPKYNFASLALHQIPLGIAVLVQTPPASMVAFWQAVFSMETFEALCVLLLGVVIFSHLTWMFERKANSSEFPAGYLDGIDDAMWWGIVTGTSIGYGDKIPITRGGRVFGSIWMVLGSLATAFFAGVVTSKMTLAISVVTPRDITDISFLSTIAYIEPDENILGDVSSKVHGILYRSAVRKMQSCAGIQGCIDSLVAGEFAAVVGDWPSILNAKKGKILDNDTANKIAVFVTSVPDVLFSIYLVTQSNTSRAYTIVDRSIILDSTRQMLEATFSLSDNGSIEIVDNSLHVVWRLVISIGCLMAFYITSLLITSLPHWLKENRGFSIRALIRSLLESADSAPPAELNLREEITKMGQCVKELKAEAERLRERRFVHRLKHQMNNTRRRDNEDAEEVDADAQGTPRDLSSRRSSGVFELAAAPPLASSDSGGGSTTSSSDTGYSNARIKQF